ncbi:MAG TPA: hypothetical protein VHY18_00605 [Solirubrobacteraceae bacterium]|jgi:hypothetical protein|nr:hypothetical protein [Solirubrobacteraceae bacterium]
MHFAVTIPEELLSRLRAGAFDVLLAPIMQSVETGPHSILSPRFKRACALLDVIGWQHGETGEEVVIDMIEHAPALHDALGYALNDALRDLRRAQPTEALMAELDREAAKHAHRHCRPASLRGRLAGRTCRLTPARRRTRGCHIA